jgi:hypothetical protein
MAEPYRSQGSASGSNFSGASPEAFGAAVGRGLEEAGGSIDRAIHTIKERDRDNQVAAAGVELAQISTDIDTAAIDARNAAAPGGEGHSAAVAKTIQERSTEALGRIKDPHVRQIFQQRYADLHERVYTREHGWEAVARAEKLVTDFDTTGTTYANAQATNPTPDGLASALTDVHAAGNALAVSADVKTKAVREQQRKVAVGWGNAMQDKDPKSLIATLDHGVLNEYLEPEDIKALRSGAHVELRRAEAEQRQQLSIAQADARERINLIGKRVAAGDFSVTDAEFAAAEGDAKKYDLKGPGFDLGVWKDKRDVARETRTFTPAQWADTINTLEAKGDKRSPAENVRLDHLKEMRGPSESRFNSDPFGAAAAAGHPAPDIDWDNPTSDQLASRVAWARTWASSTGMVNPAYLNNDELKIFRDRVKQGPVGQLEIAAQLRGMAGVGVGVAIAKQIDAGNKDLQLMIGLPPRTAELYKKGTDALQRNPKLFGVDPEDRAAVQEIFNEYVGGIPQELRTPIFNAARAITAAAADEGGRAELTGDEFENTFRASIQRAAGQIGGGNGRTGGFVNWMGRRAWLPQSMGQTEFQQRLSRATPEVWKRAGSGAPHSLAPNGKLVPLTDNQIHQLSRYQVETVSPGIYELVGPDGGHLVDDHGRPWSFDVRKLH